MSPAPPRRLAALVVSYASGGWALRCVRSLRAEWRRAGRAADDLQVSVVDNASPAGEEPWLEAIEREGARVVRSRANLGYAGGLELAWRSAAQEHRGGGGEGEDAVALLNADVELLPGSVEALLAALAARPQAGAVGPRTFFDRSRTLQLPPTPLPSAALEWRLALARMHPACARAWSSRRARRVLQWWTAREPFETPMLSGACLFLRRSVVERLGAPLDARYPLYFEDADLCRRLRRLGLAAVCEPRAEIVHAWARSSGQGTGLSGDALERFHRSRRIYLRRWHGRAGLAAAAVAQGLVRAWPAARRDRGAERFTDLGPAREPPELRWSKAGPFAVEVAMDPCFLLAAGTVGAGSSWAFDRSTWDSMFQGTYWVRVRGRASLEPTPLLGAWRFEKRSPALQPSLEEAARAPARAQA